MKATYTLIFILFISICGSKTLSAQEKISKSGYVVSLDGVRTSGKITYDKGYSNDSILFTDNKGNQTNFAPNEITGFKINGDGFYASNPKIKAATFIQQIFRGKISLYTYQDQLILTDFNGELVYLENGDDEIARQKNYNTMLTITAGYCNLENRTPYSTFKNDLGSITGILSEYHFCEGETYKSYYKGPITIEKSLSFGMMAQNFSPLDLNLSWKVESKNSLSTFFMAGFNIKSQNPKLRKTSIDIGLGISKGSYTAIVVEENSIRRFSGKQVTNVTSLHIPFIFRYNFFNQATIKPYVGLGVLNSFNFTNKKSGLINDFDKSTTYALISQGEFMNVSNFTISPVVKIGLLWKEKILLETMLGINPKSQNISFNSVQNDVSSQFGTLSIGYKF